MTPQPNLTRRARQEAMTSQYLGVDFLPRAAVGELPSTDESQSEVAMDVPTIETIDGSTGKPRPVRAPAEKQAELDALASRYHELVPDGSIATHHTQVVFGEGNPDTDLLFIGEAPGAEEDKTGRPFVGRAGKKLNEIIGAMGLERSDIYITNVVKIRPPENRTPTQSEVDASSAFLAMQIAILEPKVIVTLGAPAAKLVLNTRTAISQLRGVWSTYEDESLGLSIPVMPTFHPAYLLRQYTPENRRKVWSDMQAVMDRLGISS